jgi:GNAT superfamily N-acetyltransferase
VSSTPLTEASNREVSLWLRGKALFRHAHQEGTGFALRELLRTLTRPFLTVFHIFVFDLKDSLPSVPHPSGLVVRLFRGEKDSAAVFSALLSTGFTASELARRLQRGDLVAVAFLGDQVVAYTWMTFVDASFMEIGMMLRVDAGEAVQYDTLVLAPWRGQGLQFPLNEPVLKYAKENGYLRTLAWVDALNIRSVKNQLRTGKRILMTVVSLRLPGVRKAWNFSLGARLRSRLY